MTFEFEAAESRPSVRPKFLFARARPAAAAFWVAADPAHFPPARPLPPIHLFFPSRRRLLLALVVVQSEETEGRAFVLRNDHPAIVYGRRWRSLNFANTRDVIVGLLAIWHFFSVPSVNFFSSGHTRE